MESIAIDGTRYSTNAVETYLKSKPFYLCFSLRCLGKSQRPKRIEGEEYKKVKDQQCPTCRQILVAGRVRRLDVNRVGQGGRKVYD